MTNPIIATAKWLKETLTMWYRKKPVTIEARQLIGPAAEWHAVYQWVEANTLGSFDMNQFWVDPENFAWPKSGVSIDARDGRVVIATLEGGHWVNDGDWIIRGVMGEFYPCKPEIFEATYEKDFEEEDCDEQPTSDTRQERPAMTDHLEAARKRHWCRWCTTAIEPGETCFRQAYVYDGIPYTWLECTACNTEQISQRVGNWTGPEEAYEWATEAVIYGTPEDQRAAKNYLERASHD